MSQPDAIVRQHRERILDHRDRARRAFAGAIRQQRYALSSLNQHRLRVSPARIISQEQRTVTELGQLAAQHIRTSLNLEFERLATSQARLRALSPQATLDRGYAVVRLADGAVLRNADDTVVGETLDARLAQGSVQSVVIGRDTGAPDTEPTQPEPHAQLPDGASGWGGRMMRSPHDASDSPEATAQKKEQT